MKYLIYQTFFLKLVPLVLHRDLKTANVLINADGHAKLADFGLSKTADQKIKTIKERSESIQWMAPEVFERSRYSPESDIYSYGMVLWSICTGKKPFKGLTVIEVSKKVTSGEGEEISNNICPEFQNIIKTCWSKSIGERPSLTKIIEILKKMNVEKKLSPDKLCEQGQIQEQNHDFASAAKSYRLAADMGFFRAQTNLGMLYLSGKGVSEDKQAGYYWMLQSAKQGHGRAQYNVARMLEKGDGVEKNLQESLHWYQEASKQKIPEAMKKAEELQRKLKPDESFSFNP